MPLTLVVKSSSQPSPTTHYSRHAPPPPPQTTNGESRQCSTKYSHPSTIITKIDDSETGATVSFAKRLTHQQSANSIDGETVAGARTTHEFISRHEPPRLHSTSHGDARISNLHAIAHLQESPQPNPYRHTAMTTEQRTKGSTHWRRLPPTSAAGPRRLVQCGTRKAERENPECFSACTNDAKGNVYRVL